MVNTSVLDEYISSTEVGRYMHILPIKIIWVNVKLFVSCLADKLYTNSISCIIIYCKNKDDTIRNIFDY